VQQYTGLELRTELKIDDNDIRNQKKRGSSPGTPHDKTPSKRSKTDSSSCGRPPKASNFVAVEDVALTKAYVNVTLNPINGVGQKSKTFWDHIHRKHCLFRQPIRSTSRARLGVLEEPISTPDPKEDEFL
jgi:hypothetical protein